MASELTKLREALKSAQAKADTLERSYAAEVIERRALHNQLQDMIGSLRVACRVRPLTKSERASHARSVVQVDAALGRVAVEHKGAGERESATRPFEFTHVFGPDSTQEDVFKATEPLMTSVLDGYNVCIFAYGQSGTGKTFTMEGTAEQPGLAPRAMACLFGIIGKHHEQGDVQHEAFLSMLEIYNEGIRDLLADPKQPPKKYDITNDGALGMYVRNLASLTVESAARCRELISTGNVNRAVGVTNLNEQSSRSHMLVTLVVLTTNTRTGARHVGKLSLVDLAGSERLSKTDASGQTLKEAQAINKSLSALGNVLNTLARKEAHVPYRDSKLTYLLQDSLGGNSKTLMLVAVGPASENSAETVNSLNFASRAKAVVLGKADVRELKDGTAKASVAVGSGAAAARERPGSALKPARAAPGRK